MKRRSFLGLLGGAVVAPVASLEAAPKRPTVHFGLMGRLDRPSKVQFLPYEPSKSPHNA